MIRALQLQLPIPQLNYGKRTGNIPLAAEYLTIGIADVSLQQRWLLLTESEPFSPGAFEVT